MLPCSCCCCCGITKGWMAADSCRRSPLPPAPPPPSDRNLNRQVAQTLKIPSGGADATAGPIYTTTIKLPCCCHGNRSHSSALQVREREREKSLTSENTVGGLIRDKNSEAKPDPKTGTANAQLKTASKRERISWTNETTSSDRDGQRRVSRGA